MNDDKGTHLFLENGMTHYLISKSGKIYNTKTDKYVPTQFDTKGNVTISINEKIYLVSELVAITYSVQGAILNFLGRKIHPTYIDDDKTNTHIDNLSWVEETIDLSKQP